MNAAATTPPRIVAIGETLWDLLPDGPVWGGAPGNAACHAAGLGAALRDLAARHALRLAALTRGKAGSVLVAAGQTSLKPARATTIVDTVGAGDAFTAAVIVGLLRDDPLEAIHDHATRLAAFVCGHRGATPAIPATLRA